MVFRWVVLSCILVAIPLVIPQYNQYTNPLAPYQPNPSGLPDVIRIAGLFDEADPTVETAFKHAVDHINAEHTILPRSRLSTQMERLSPGDSYHAAEKVCEMMGSGIAAVFGPQSSEAASHVQSICDAFELPHIETKWDYKIRKDNYLINLAPHPATLSNAINDLVEAFEWSEYIILYENDEGLFKLQDLIKNSVRPERRASLRQLPPDENFTPLLKDILRATTIRKLVIDCSIEKLEEFLKQAQQVGLMTYEFSYIITSLDLQVLDLEPYLHGESNITAMRLVNQDDPEIQDIVKDWNNLVNAGNGNQNNYGQRNQYYGQTSPPNYGYKDQPRQNDKGKMMAHQSPPVEENFKYMKTETALIYDAVYLFSKALHVLDSSQRIDIRPLSCESTDTWQHGYSIINYMKMVQLEGITGLIQFDTSGYRSDVQMDVIQLTPAGLKKVGVWDSKYVTKFNWSRPEAEEKVSRDVLETMDLKNRTLVITTILNDPFCMYKKSTSALSGNEQFEGYSVDLAEHLSQLLGFKYRIQLVTDGNYGSLKNGIWNGMISDILDDRADIAIADLTINRDRQTAVDFTMPFMNLGISILHAKPKAKPPSLFSFLSPFSVDVWVYMCFAFFGVSIILFIIARLSPYEWDCPHPCIEDPDELENQFTLLNSFWFTVGSLMQQGSDVAPKWVLLEFINLFEPFCFLILSFHFGVTPCEWRVEIFNDPNSGSKEPEVMYINDLSFPNALWVIMAGLLRQKPTILPKATSTRMIAGIWWFFTLIMVSSYTANLASFLIVQDLEDTIKSLDDLPKQDKVKYGCLKGGSTYGFFQKSDFPTQKKIFENMEKMNPSPYVKGNEEGVQRVKSAKGNYAFFVESTVLEYIEARNCELVQVGGLLDSKGYGVALRKGSRYRQQFNSAVLNLQEKGKLSDLKRKWWKEQRMDGVQCSAAAAGSAVDALKLDNVGGVFVVLVGGCIFAILFAVMEFYCKTRETAKAAGDPIKDALSKELKFALEFSGDSKPVLKNNKKDSLTSDSNEPTMGSNQLLDLGMDPLSSMHMQGYGFPKPVSRVNGGVPPDGFT